MIPIRYPQGAALVAALLSISALTAQTVQVPLGCRVVVPGVNGTTGEYPTGRVGDGGVVVMPDPYAGGTFSFSGGTVSLWFGDGDLLFRGGQVPPEPPDWGSLYTPPSQTKFICSYNAHLRAPEAAAPSLSTYARSKGRVRVRFSKTPGVIEFVTFEVFKNYSPASYLPPIAGTQCFPTTGTTLTFSVDPMASDATDDGLDPITQDLYYWTFLNGLGADLFQQSGASFTFSPDRSSVTIQRNTAFSTWFNNGNNGGYVLQCCYGRANEWDNGTAVKAIIPKTCVHKEFGVSQLAITAYCLNVGMPGTSTVSTPAYPGCSYVWSIPAELGSPTTLSGATASYNSVGMVGTYRIAVNCNMGAGCQTVRTPYTVNVSYTGISGQTYSVRQQPRIGSTTLSAPGGLGNLYQLYDCNTHAAIGIPGPGNTFTLSTPGSGSFTILITENGSCTRMFKPPCVATSYRSSVVSDRDTEEADGLTLDDMLQVGPDPGGSAFQVTLLQDVDEGSITVFDATGKVVARPQRIVQGTNRVELPSLIDGLYVLRVEADGQVTCRRMLMVRE